MQQFGYFGSAYALASHFQDQRKNSRLPNPSNLVPEELAP